VSPARGRERSVSTKEEGRGRTRKDEGREERGRTTTDDNSRTVVLRLNARVKSRLRSTSKVLKLEDTSRSVPEDRLALLDRLSEEFPTLRSSVETHDSLGDTLLVGRRADFGVLVELVGGDVVDGEDELDVLRLGLLDEGGDLLGAVLVEERVADRDVVEGLLEGESHAAADDEGVDLQW
jgi:hypothetical protein